jgi:hypothetical protein
MVQRVDGRRYPGQSHRLAVTRGGVGRIAGLGTDDLLEDQDVAALRRRARLVPGGSPAGPSCCASPSIFSVSTSVAAVAPFGRQHSQSPQL